jgi:hypothetical protein
MVDCRDFPSDSNCSLSISGEAEEVVRAAAMHAADVHGHENSPELREQIRSMLRDEGAPEARSQVENPWPATPSCDCGD